MPTGLRLSSRLWALTLADPGEHGRKVEAKTGGAPDIHTEEGDPDTAIGKLRLQKNVRSDIEERGENTGIAKRLALRGAEKKAVQLPAGQSDNRHSGAIGQIGKRDGTGFFVGHKIRNDPAPAEEIGERDDHGEASRDLAG